MGDGAVFVVVGGILERLRFGDEHAANALMNTEIIPQFLSIINDGRPDTLDQNSYLACALIL